MFALLVSLLITLNPGDTVGVTNPVDTLSNRDVEVGRILIVGNKKTNESIILREMETHPGDELSYRDLELQLKTDRERIYNTRLFNSVDVEILDVSESSVDILITLSERWYTFPAPILELVDRNFNDWWVNENHDISRTNYGINLYQLNMRGRNETLKFIAQLGFTKKFGINYEIPYIDKAQRSGLEFNFAYAENYNVAYQTIQHKRDFLDGGGSIRRNTEVGLTYRMRRTFNDYHYISLLFENTVINDTITDLNSEYFRNGTLLQRYVKVGYSYRKDKRDVIAYPLHGYKMDLSISKTGLGIFDDVNYATLFGTFSNYTDLGSNYYLSNHTALYANSTKDITYNNYYGMGYRVYFVRGYELYLVEGPKFFLNKTTFKKLIWSHIVHMESVPLEQFSKLPIQIYLKGYFDFGYVENYPGYEQNTLLSDKWLYGGGFGLDLVTWYDVVFRTEYSMNHLGESRFFFHFIKEF